MIAQFPRPPVIMIARIMVDRLVDAAMHRQIGLFVAVDTEQADA